MSEKPKTALGFLGSQLDTPTNESRWSRWRPTVALCQHDDLIIDRLELLADPRLSNLIDTVVGDIAAVSPETEVVVHPLILSDPWDFEEVYAELHDFCRQRAFDPHDRDLFAHITTGTHVAQICLFLLTEARTFPGRLIQTSPRGDEDGTRGSYSIIDLDLSKYDRIANRFAREHEEDLSFLKSGIQTASPNFNQLVQDLERVAIHSRDPILLLGPTGAGKSQLARRIHELKVVRQKVDGEFVEVNCATIQGATAMSTLFGHERGAFTSAVAGRPGLLRSANQGVLFLDEIGELGLDEQAMLLRAVEEKRFRPLGADREVESDFQLIAGSNRDLRLEVAEGRFRDDLLSRICLWTFELPALAARREDIEPNLDYELDSFAVRTGRDVRFNREARQSFLKFAVSREATWPGNFRDLNAAITRMATLARGGRIQVDDVRAEVERLRRNWQHKGEDPDELVLSSVLKPKQIRELDRFDRVQLADVVRVLQASKSLSEAGRELFGVSRSRKKSPNDADRLRKYLARYDLDWGQFK